MNPTPPSSSERPINTHQFKIPEGNEGIEFVLGQLLEVQNNKGYIISSQKQFLPPAIIALSLKQAIISTMLSEDIDQDEFINGVGDCLIQNGITNRGGLRTTCLIALWNMFKEGAAQWTEEHQDILNKIEAGHESYQENIPVVRHKITSQLAEPGHFMFQLEFPKENEGILSVFKQLQSAQDRGLHVVNDNDYPLAPKIIAIWLDRAIFSLREVIKTKDDNISFSQLIQNTLEESGIPERGELRMACYLGLMNDVQSQSTESWSEIEAAVDKITGVTLN